MLSRQSSLRSLRFLRGGIRTNQWATKTSLEVSSWTILSGQQRCVSSIASSAVGGSLSNLSFTANLAAHGSQISCCPTLGGLLYSPLGTAMLVLLAYNVIAIVSKQFHYAHDLTAKDYIQDLGLYTIMYYGIMLCILLGMEVLFIEV